MGVEGFGGVLFCKDVRTVLVADQVLVVGGQQMRRVARSGCRSVAEYEKFPVAEMFGREFFGDARHGAAGFGRGESRPPGEIGERGGGVAAEIAEPMPLHGKVLRRAEPVRREGRRS